MKTGILERVYDNETSKGVPYLGLVIDGDRYSLFDQFFFDENHDIHAFKGEEVEFTYAEKGQYRNVTHIQPKGEVWVKDEETGQKVEMTRKLALERIRDGIEALINLENG